MRNRAYSSCFNLRVQYNNSAPVPWLVRTNQRTVAPVPFVKKVAERSVRRYWKVLFGSIAVRDSSWRGPR